MVHQVPLHREGEAGDILGPETHLPEKQGEGGGVVLAGPNPEPQGAEGPLLQVGDGLLPSPVDPPKLQADGLLEGGAPDHVVKGGLGPVVLAHARGNKTGGGLLHQLAEVGVQGLPPGLCRLCWLLRVLR